MAAGAAANGRTNSMLEVVSVLTSFHRNHARIKMLRVSISVIRSVRYNPYGLQETP